MYPSCSEGERKSEVRCSHYRMTSRNKTFSYLIIHHLDNCDSRRQKRAHERQLFNILDLLLLPTQSLKASKHHPRISASSPRLILIDTSPSLQSLPFNQLIRDTTPQEYYPSCDITPSPSLLQNLPEQPSSYALSMPTYQPRYTPL